AAALAMVVVLTSCHWLKNLLWHGDPLFPLLHRYLPSTPYWPGFNLDAGVAAAAWVPQGSLSHRLWESLKAAVTFSFVPHDWSSYHGDVPVFGSLFTLMLPVLLFLRGTRRIWFLAAATMVGVFIWFWTYHQDRYLQALVPWMAAVTAAGLALAWRAGRAARV